MKLVVCMLKGKTRLPVLQAAALLLWILEAWHLVEWTEETVGGHWVFVSLWAALALLLLAMMMKLLEVVLVLQARSEERGCRFRRKEVPAQGATANAVTWSCYALV